MQNGWPHRNIYTFNSKEELHKLQALLAEMWKSLPYEMDTSGTIPLPTARQTGTNKIVLVGLCTKLPNNGL